MKSIVKGKVVDKIYSVDCAYNIPQNVNEKSVLVRKPKLKVEEKVIYENICEFEGNYVLNKRSFESSIRDILKSTSSSIGDINISEDEEVKIEKTIFRADLNEQHIFTSKVIKENEINKEITVSDLKLLLKEWNRQEIEGDERLLAHCRLYNLTVENTSVEDLRRVLYNNLYRENLIDFYTFQEKYLHKLV